MTVQQIHNATQDHPDAPYVVGGKQLSRVVLVGRVHKRVDSTSNYVFTLEDGTGSIDVNLYSTEESEVAELQQIP